MRTCSTCSAPFTPRNPRVYHCAAHEPSGRDQRSPSTRAQDPEYERNRQLVLAGDPPCSWCCAPHATTADHVIPASPGGGNALDNLVPACESCNFSRKDNPGWKPRREMLTGAAGTRTRTTC